MENLPVDTSTLLTNYGFEKTPEGLWTISRTHTNTKDVLGNARDKVREQEDQVTFRELEGGRWAFTAYNGAKPFANFETDDVRDVIAFAQTFIASSIFNISGYPLDEGFEFEGMMYTSPFMFGPYWDFETTKIGDVIWAKHPEGEFRHAYLAWRDDFADRVLKQQAAAPDEFHAVAAPLAGAKPSI
jgi:hypothetical protein